jgi:uncharacterized protein (DUF2235 family)
MPKKLVLCLDGTWNIRDDTTNVWRVHALTDDLSAEDQHQVRYYDQGVGTRWYDSLTGGAFGVGLYDTVRRAYNWIAETYRPEDTIYMFGFSRGAATVLSLANLIDRCGIVGPKTYNTFEDAYRLYRLKGVTRDSQSSRAFRLGAAESGCSASPLHFLGLFDTVESLYLRNLSGETMHVLTLPETARHVSHAIALDERRRMFQSVRFPCAPTEGHLHERWFSGAHANIGGGYRFDPLATAPLRWMLEQAAAAGLAFREVPDVDLSELLSIRERDSHDEFAFGIPALISLPFDNWLRDASLVRYRTIGRNTAGEAEEWIDGSAIARYAKFATYRKASKAMRAFMGNTCDRSQGEINVKQHLERTPEAVQDGSQ